MAKYRKLTKDELESMEKEFIDFLIINGITGEDWEKMKSADVEKAEKMTELFSDVVFEKILRDIQYIDHYSRTSVKTFKCDAEKITLIAMDTASPDADLSTPTGVERAKNDPPKDLEIYRTSKAYHPSREAEIYKMLEQGCQISKGSLFEALAKTLDRD